MKTYMAPEQTEFHRWDWIKVDDAKGMPFVGAHCMTCVMRPYDEAERFLQLIRTASGWYNPKTQLLETITPTHYAYDQI